MDITEELTKTNAVDIISWDENALNILKKISYPFELCKYCNIVDAEWFEWSISKQKIDRRHLLI
nr:hypothetical protein [uncultured Schaedlerella sp.]